MRIFSLWTPFTKQQTDTFLFLQFSVAFVALKKQQPSVLKKKKKKEEKKEREKKERNI